MTAPPSGGGTVGTQVEKFAPSTLTTVAPFLQDFPRPSNDDIAAARELWWRWRRHHGVDLPAERGVIVIEGGAQ